MVPGVFGTGQSASLRAMCSKLSEGSKCAEMESQLFTKNESATTGSTRTIASIVIEEDMTSCKLTSRSMARKNSVLTVNKSLILLIMATMELIKA